MWQFCIIAADRIMSLFCCYTGVCCCLCLLQKFGWHAGTGSKSLYNQLTIPHCTITQNTLIWATPITKASDVTRDQLSVSSVPARAPSVWQSPTAPAACQDWVAVSRACGCSLWLSAQAAWWFPSGVCAACHTAFWTPSCGCIWGRRRTPTTHTNT